MVVLYIGGCILASFGFAVLCGKMIAAGAGDLEKMDTERL